MEDQGFLVELVSGHRFYQRAGETILAAAARHGISLPYSCKSGRCATCKCKAVSGATAPLHPEVGLSDEEKKQGWLYSCVRTAVTNTLLDADDLGRTEIPVPKIFPCRISQINRLTHNVIQVFLRLPSTSSFRFIPGQYIDVSAPNGVCRSYSLANGFLLENCLELHIRKVEGGAMSDYWFNHAKVNDLLRFSGPLGTFFLRETKDISLIFLATGTGIAPVKAMLESMTSLESAELPRAISILWGGRKSHDLYLNMGNIPGRFNYTPVLSRAENYWSGAKGYIQDVLLDSKPDLVDATVYACGSGSMIASARTILVAAGLNPKNFYSDPFVSSNGN